MSKPLSNPIPIWLTRQYIEDAIRFKYHDNTLRILKFEAKPATKDGDNYASAMFRIYVKYLTKTSDIPKKANYILKTSYEQLASDSFGGIGISRKVLEPYDVYRREMIMYDSIIPKFCDILRTIGYNEDLVPGAIKTDHTHQGLMLEDLGNRNYVIVSNMTSKIGLDSKHAEIVLKKMARFHAASIILNEMEPWFFRNIDRGLFNTHTDAFEPFFTGYLEACGQTVSHWEGFEKYGKKLLQLVPKIMEYGRRVFKPEAQDLNALIHGDLWTNNILFNYNDAREPLDAIFIDFQFSCWTSPAIDLHYFFNTSLTEDLREKHTEELIQCYYSILADSLQALHFGGKIPTLHEFQLEYGKKEFYAVIAACIIQPVLVNDKKADGYAFASLGNDEFGRGFKRSVYRNERVQSNLKHLLPVFDRRGLLDIDQ